MVVISVVRDFSLYERLVRQNARYRNKRYEKNTQFVPFDNRAQNEAVPVLYNRFLNDYDFSVPDWFIFCHEDWEALTNMHRVLGKLSLDCIYGACGAYYNAKNNTKYLYGQIIQSKRDGTHRIKWGVPIFGQKVVDTVDCQCLIVHSSLIQKFNLRFDENLSFDFYTEEFSICAREKHDIKTKVVQMKCRHYSHGNPAEAFFNAVEYVSQKYQNRLYSYGATCTSALIKEGSADGEKGDIKSMNLSIGCRLKRKARTLTNAIFHT